MQWSFRPSNFAPYCLLSSTLWDLKASLLTSRTLEFSRLPSQQHVDDSTEICCHLETYYSPLLQHFLYAFSWTWENTFVGSCFWAENLFGIVCSSVFAALPSKWICIFHSLNRTLDGKVGFWPPGTFSLVTAHLSVPLSAFSSYAWVESGSSAVAWVLSCFWISSTKKSLLLISALPNLPTCRQNADRLFVRLWHE